MAYPDFSNRDLIKQFNLRFQGKQLFETIPNMVCSGWLQESLQIAMSVGFSNEKSRSERLVSPMLLELARKNNHRVTIYSGENLDADETQGLNGECDFMLSFSQVREFVTAPIFCITEAKKQNIERGMVQCAAQLIGARIFNEKYEQQKMPVLYGCATTGVEWRFIQLKDNILTVDINRYLITQPEQILGVLQQIISVSSKAV